MSHWHTVCTLSGDPFYIVTYYIKGSLLGQTIHGENKDKLSIKVINGEKVKEEENFQISVSEHLFYMI